MARYTTRHDLAPVLPDGRLVQTTFTTNGRGLHCIGFDYLRGHIDPDLVRDIGEMSRLLSYTARFTAQASLVGTQPLWNGWIERIPANLMLPLRTSTLRAAQRAGHFYELRFRADMISPELADELNAVVFPYLNTTLELIVQSLRESVPLDKTMAPFP